MAKKKAAKGESVAFFIGTHCTMSHVQQSFPSTDKNKIKSWKR